MTGNQIAELFITYFWEVAEAIVPLLVPIIAIMILFKLVYDLLLRR